MKAPTVYRVQPVGTLRCCCTALGGSLLEFSDALFDIHSLRKETTNRRERTPALPNILEEIILQASSRSYQLSADLCFCIRRKRAKKFCYGEILGWCTGSVGLSAIHCRPILPAWNVSSTYPPFEQELVELTLTPASRPLTLGVDPISSDPRRLLLP